MSVVKWVLFFVFFPSNTLLSQIRDSTFTVYFPTNVFELDEAQIEQIKQFAAAVCAITKVTGYADSIGPVEYNLKLSLKRAKSVGNVLKQNLSEKEIEYRGETIVLSNELSKNRAVEITGYVSNNPIIDIFDIEYIFFVPDKAIITPESLANIQSLVKRLNRYKNACFELIGHVNYESRRSSSVLNSMFKLSELRASLIKDLLVEREIPAYRIQSRGVGNTQPLYPNPVNDNERKQNMRVQVIVYSCAR